MGAVHTVAQVGTREQVSQASQVLVEARQNLYRILAGDTPASTYPSQLTASTSRPQLGGPKRLLPATNRARRPPRPAESASGVCARPPKARPVSARRRRGLGPGP